MERDVLTLDEFIEKTGVKTSHICKVCGLTRQTIFRIRHGLSVSQEVADKIRWFTNGAVHVPSTGRHVSHRSKTVCA